MENSITEPETDLLDVASLVEMFEASEDATLDARAEAERDRDYVDNKQLTAEEIAVLKKRGQPIVVANRIKRKIDFLRGFEMSQRVDPRAMPRTPAHEDDAQGVEQALRYVADDQDIDHKRSGVWNNILVEGAGGYRVSVEDKYNEICIRVDRIAWDRMFWDPHSSETDFSDAAYLGLVRWDDVSEAKRQYPDAVDAIEQTVNTTTISDTYDDKPKFNVWADKKRKRIRICQIWIKRGGEWYWAEYTKGGILKSGPSPHKTDKGESDCELIFASGYVNRDNERYGIVREMISLQDEINKRRSKSLHLLNTEQTIAERGVVQDVEVARRERARPDGWTEVAPGALQDGRIKFETRTDLASGHMQLLQEAKNEIDMMGGNIALQGDALSKSSAASGKAIIASQQGGAMEIEPLLDSLRHADIRLFRAIWYRIRQYWTEEKWVRVTDDERNVKWLGLNVDPMKMEMLAMQNPEAAQKLAGSVQNVAELDCDIIIDDAPDGLTPQLEQFQSLVELKKMDANGELPFRAILTAMPNLKNKEQVLAQMDQAQQGPGAEEQMAAAQQAAQMQLQMAMQAKQAEQEQELRGKAAEKQLDLEAKREEQAMQLETKAKEAEIQLEMKRAEMSMKARETAEAQETVRREKDAELGPANADVLQALAENAQMMQSAIMTMIEDRDSETELVRDEAGRAIGARKVRRNRTAA